MLEKFLLPLIWLDFSREDKSFVESVNSCMGRNDSFLTIAEEEPISIVGFSD
jgi:hypothetical protein